MARYLILLEGRPAALDASDAQTQDYNQRWTDWATSLAEEGSSPPVDRWNRRRRR